MLIGLLLGAIAVVLATEMKSLLIGEVGHRRPIVDAIERRHHRRRPGCASLIHLRTEHLGPEDLLVGAKVDFDPTLSFAELARTIDAVEVEIRAAVPAARLIYLEPDVPAREPDDPPASVPAASAEPDGVRRYRRWPWPSTTGCASSSRRSARSSGRSASRPRCRCATWPI